MEAVNDAEDFATILARGGTLPRINSPVVPSVNGHGKSGGGHKRPKKPTTNGRWQVLNSFVDESARRIGTTEQAAWVVLFREARANGLVKMSFAQIAEREAARTPRYRH